MLSLCLSNCLFQRRIDIKHPSLQLSSITCVLSCALRSLQKQKNLNFVSRNLFFTYLQNCVKINMRSQLHSCIRNSQYFTTVGVFFQQVVPGRQCLYYGITRFGARIIPYVNIRQIRPNKIKQQTLIVNTNLILQ